MNGFIFIHLILMEPSLPARPWPRHCGYNEIPLAEQQGEGQKWKITSALGRRARGESERSEEGPPGLRQEDVRGKRPAVVMRTRS